MGRGSASTSHVNDSMNKNVAKQQPLATPGEVKEAIGTSDRLRYVKNDTYVADPSLILGSVYYEETDSEALTSFLTGVCITVAESSVITAPQIISELIIDSRICGSSNVFSLLSISASQDDVYELRVINNYTARATTRGPEWIKALADWHNLDSAKRLTNDPKVRSITIVTGVVQKYITSKKFSKFEAGVKGGGFGINVAGKLYTSSSHFQMDVIYGIDLASIKVGGVDVQKISERIAEGKVMSKVGELKHRNQLFDNMAMTSKSIFPSTC